MPMVSLLLPAIAELPRVPKCDAERQVAALRMIEAVRMYAAEPWWQHFRKRWTKSPRCRCRPIRRPAKPFVYHLDGKTAVLDLPPSDQHAQRQLPVRNSDGGG